MNFEKILFDAAANGDIIKVEQLISSGIDPNSFQKVFTKKVLPEKIVTKKPDAWGSIVGFTKADGHYVIELDNARILAPRGYKEELWDDGTVVLTGPRFSDKAFILGAVIAVTDQAVYNNGVIDGKIIVVQFNPKTTTDDTEETLKWLKERNVLIIDREISEQYLSYQIKTEWHENSLRQVVEDEKFISPVEIALENKQYPVLQYLVHQNAFVDKALYAAIKDGDSKGIEILGNIKLSMPIIDLTISLDEKKIFLELVNSRKDVTHVELQYRPRSRKTRKEDIAHIDKLLEHNSTALSKLLGIPQEVCSVSIADEVIIVKILNSTPEAKLIQMLRISGRKPTFYNVLKNTDVLMLFYKPIDGISIAEWENEKPFIQDVLGVPVDIEEYDPTHPLYCSEYGKERLILIRESNISALPKELGLTGNFLKSSDGMHVFQDVVSRDEWQEKLEAIRAFLGTRVSIAEYDAERGHLVLGESIEQTLGKTLGIEDNGRASELLYTQTLPNGKHCHFYSEVDGLDNLGEWKRSLKKIRRLLNSNVLIEETDNHDRSIPVDADRLIALREVDYIPEPSQMKELEILQRLEKGKLYWGEGIEGAYLTDISDASHMLIMGESGSGKSNFMNGLILSLLHSIETIEHIYMVDFKGGVELHEYADLIPQKIEMVDYKLRLLTLLKRIQLEMEARLKYMRAQGIRKITQNPIFLIIDEFADISQMEESTHEERLLKEQILSILRELTRKARATNIKIWAMLQEANADNMEPSFKNQLQSRVLLKTTEENTARFAISDNHLNEIGLDVARMPRGRIAFVDASQERIKAVELQFPLVDKDDIAPDEKKMYRLELSQEHDKSFSQTIEGYFEQVFEERPELNNLHNSGVETLVKNELSVKTDVPSSTSSNHHMMDDFEIDDEDDGSSDIDLEEAGKLYVDVGREMKEYEKGKY